MATAVSDLHEQEITSHLHAKTHETQAEKIDIPPLAAQYIHIFSAWISSLLHTLEQGEGSRIPPLVIHQLRSVARDPFILFAWNGKQASSRTDDCRAEGDSPSAREFMAPQQQPSQSVNPLLASVNKSSSMTSLSQGNEKQPTAQTIAFDSCQDFEQDELPSNLHNSVSNAALANDSWQSSLPKDTPKTSTKRRHKNEETDMGFDQDFIHQAPNKRPCAVLINDNSTNQTVTTHSYAQHKGASSAIGFFPLPTHSDNQDEHRGKGPRRMCQDEIDQVSNRCQSSTTTGKGSTDLPTHSSLKANKTCGSAEKSKSLGEQALIYSINQESPPESESEYESKPLQLSKKANSKQVSREPNPTEQRDGGVTKSHQVADQNDVVSEESTKACRGHENMPHAPIMLAWNNILQSMTRLQAHRQATLLDPTLNQYASPFDSIGINPFNTGRMSMAPQPQPTEHLKGRNDNQTGFARNVFPGSYEPESTRNHIPHDPVRRYAATANHELLHQNRLKRPQNQDEKVIGAQNINSLPSNHRLDMENLHAVAASFKIPIPQLQQGLDELLGNRHKEDSLQALQKFWALQQSFPPYASNPPMDGTDFRPGATRHREQSKQSDHPYPNRLQGDQKLVSKNELHDDCISQTTVADPKARKEQTPVVSYPVRQTPPHPTEGRDLYSARPMEAPHSRHMHSSVPNQPPSHPNLDNHHQIRGWGDGMHTNSDLMRYSGSVASEVCAKGDRVHENREHEHRAQAKPKLYHGKYIDVERSRSGHDQSYVDAKKSARVEFPMTDFRPSLLQHPRSSRESKLVSSLTSLLTSGGIPQSSGDQMKKTKEYENASETSSQRTMTEVAVAGGTFGTHSKPSIATKSNLIETPERIELKKRYSAVILKALSDPPDEVCSSSVIIAMISYPKNSTAKRKVINGFIAFNMYIRHKYFSDEDIEDNQVLLQLISAEWARAGPDTKVKFGALGRSLTQLRDGICKDPKVKFVQYHPHE